MNSNRGQRQWYGNYFLFLLPLYFVFHGYTDNYPLVSAKECLFLFLKYTFLTILLVSVFFLVIRSWRTSAVLTFLVLAFQFFFGPVHDTLKSLFPGLFITKYIFIIPATLFVFSFLLFHFRKKKYQFINFVLYLNILFALLLLIDVAQLVIKTTQRPDPDRLMAGLSTCDTCARPDIFLIIADEYAGKRELQDIFGFDNALFENALTQRGFFIADSSTSNYNYTPFTIASMLDMQYLQGIEGRNKSREDRALCFRKINNNPVINFFRHTGYSFHNFGIFRFADKLPLRSTNFYKTGIDLVKAPTFTQYIKKDIGFNLVTRLRIRSQIELVSYHHLRLNETIYRESWEEISRPANDPRFFYIHLEMPHYPYYFDRNGKPYPLEEIQEDSFTDKGKYIEYLYYSNNKLLQLIDHILNKAKAPPIILLMSDHGYRNFANDPVPRKYHFMNLNAVYLPERRFHSFYKGMSTVNQFRTLLNTSFQQNLPILKDSSSFLKE